MTIIFNAILRIQYFPKPWKLAQFKMLHKPGKDLHQTASYRPISLLPVFSKILEKIIYCRIKTIIETRKLIPDHQFGFRNKHSTIEQMHRLINEIIVALENKEYCTALFMDIEKAFDKINHESLLQAIRKQFPEQIHQLIKSYLSSRIFVIRIKDTHSEVKDIKARVPQGSVLGSILYTSYTANIATTTNSTVLTFADDITILVRYTNPETAVKLQQEHITKIEKWLQEKQIKANPNKCNHITFTLRRKIPPNILLNGTHITQTKHVKYLGLHLDTQLTWKLHIKSIIEKIKKTRRQMHWLTSRKSKLSIENKLKIYKTIIKPIWTYGIPLWGTAAMSHINKIEIIQAKILRTVVNAPWYVRNNDIPRDLGIPTVMEEISRYSEKYKSRIATHPNRLAAETHKTINMDRRLKRKHPADLIKNIT